MFNPLNLGVFRLLFLVVEVYILAPVGCECVCFWLREKFFIPARYFSLTQRSYCVYTRMDRLHPLGMGAPCGLPSVCMYVCVCMYVFVCMYVCVCMCVFVCMYVWSPYGPKGKSDAVAVEWQHVFCVPPKKQSLMFLRENILTTVFNVHTWVY